MPSKIDPDQKKFLIAFLRAKQAEKSEKVAKAGRPLKSFGSEDLKERWVTILKRLATKPDDEALRLAADMIEGELSLRGEEVPLWRVTTELEAFDAHLRSLGKTLSDERKAEIDEEIADDMARLFGWDEPQH